MKVLQKIAVIGLCALAPACVFAQDSSEQSQAAHQGMMHHGMMEHAIAPQTPTELNRASKIIGTEVVNQQNQKLGSVKDLVVDPQSQRVAYAWIEKSDETSNTGKYVAVPLNLLKPSSDQKDLVLNADKSRFSSAQGYAKNQLPNMAMSNTQLSFWESITEPAGAQPGMEQKQ